MKQLAPVIVMLATTGCGLMSARQLDKTDFDFGPPAALAADTAKASAVAVVVHDITSPAWMDHSAMYYRLAYRNAANPMPYAQSGWVMSPAALLTQRLRLSLTAPADGTIRRTGTNAPPIYALRAELVEFEQVFDQPGHSRGVLRLRASLEGEGIWAQRTFTIEKPAPSADAAGGVTALTECSDALAARIREWVAATGSDSRATQSARNGS
jgi:cholesterol transport system auxiliary component